MASWSNSISTLKVFNTKNLYGSCQCTIIIQGVTFVLSTLASGLESVIVLGRVCVVGTLGDIYVF